MGIDAADAVGQPFDGPKQGIKPGTPLRIEHLDRGRIERTARGLLKLEPKDQVLAIDLRDRDPDLAFSEVPYQKGRLFLSFLEAKFGRERFDAFLHAYFDHFAFKSITTEEFNQYLSENLLDRFPGIVAHEQVLAWENAPGIPADAVLPVNAISTRTKMIANERCAQP